jgi:excisionase family DNA binding protein
MTELLALSIPKAAKALDCSPDTIRKMVARGDLRAIRLMGKISIPVAELERITDGVRPALPPLDPDQIGELARRLVDEFARRLAHPPP